MQRLSLRVGHLRLFRPRNHQTDNFLRLGFGKRMLASFQASQAAPHPVELHFAALAAHSTLTHSIAAHSALARAEIVARRSAAWPLSQARKCDEKRQKRHQQSGAKRRGKWFFHGEFYSAAFWA